MNRRKTGIMYTKLITVTREGRGTGIYGVYGKIELYCHSCVLEGDVVRKTYLCSLYNNFKMT